MGERRSFSRESSRERHVTRAGLREEVEALAASDVDSDERGAFTAQDASLLDELIASRVASLARTRRRT